MTTFWEAWNAEVSAIKSTPAGAAFVAAGFDVQMTGGGCMAWEVKSADGSAYVWVTDSEGFAVTLGEGDTADQYIIGLYVGDADGQVGDIIEAGRDPATAIAKAIELLAPYGGQDQAERVSRLGCEYVRIVGYNPFVDCPTIDVEEVAAVIRDMPATIAAEGGPVNLLAELQARGMR